MGERQKGRSDLKLASLRSDKDWVTSAREVAFAIVDGDGGLESHPDASTSPRSSISTRRTRSSCSRASGRSVTCGPTGDMAPDQHSRRSVLSVVGHRLSVS